MQAGKDQYAGVQQPQKNHGGEKKSPERQGQMAPQPFEPPIEDARRREREKPEHRHRPGAKYDDIVKFNIGIQNIVPASDILERSAKKKNEITQNKKIFIDREPRTGCRMARKKFPQMPKKQRKNK